MLNQQNRFKLSQNGRILNIIEVVVEVFQSIKDDTNKKYHISGARYN